MEAPDDGLTSLRGLLAPCSTLANKTKSAAGAFWQNNSAALSYGRPFTVKTSS